MPAPKKPRTRKAKPPAPRQVRVAVNAPPVRDSEATFTFGNKLVAAATANPGVLGTSPYLAPLKTALVTQGAAIIAAQGGPDAAQVALVTANGKVHQLTMQHAGWVQATASGMAAAEAQSFIALAGLEEAKVGQHAPVTSPEVTNGPPGTIHFEVPNDPGFLMCFTEVSLDGGLTYARSTDTEHVKGDIKGLPSGQKLTVRLRAYVRGTGYTPWTVLPIVVT